MPNGRTSLILRCSQEHADKIRQHAAAEHRHVAGYILRLLEGNLRIEETYDDRFTLAMVRETLEERTRAANQTAIHVRCTTEQAARIRKAAARRELSISKFIVFAIERSWRAAERVRQGSSYVSNQ
jgi:uncharacterized protein (DUF1778 family)